ncbi:hypothetical protein ENUP19_0317G0036 [Entamoeba nuttalli]|uniref:Uncharacterized protein n=1 Tax=Entamoeba nuttalli TaxID=412467 RepID=A0ABQ0DVZ3_9EUKA
MPSTLVVPKVRSIILKVLYALSKWSMLDSYVMVLMIINLYVYLAYEFVTLMLGTIESLIISHVVVGVHNVVLHDKQSNHGEYIFKWKPIFFYCRFLVTKIISCIDVFVVSVITAIIELS